MYQKRSFLPQKCSPLTQNGRNPQKASVYPRIYLGLKYEHWATSGSRDMTNIPKTCFFAPKLNRGDFFLLRVYFILSTCRVLKYQVPNPNSNRDIATWRFGVKNSVFCPKNVSGWFFFIKCTLYIRHVSSVKIWRPNSKQLPRYYCMKIWVKKRQKFEF